MNDTLGIYLNDIGKVPLLTADEERELARVIEGGQKAAGGGKEEFTDSPTMTGQVRVRKYSHFVFALYIRIYR